MGDTAGAGEDTGTGSDGSAIGLLARGAECAPAPEPGSAASDELPAAGPGPPPDDDTSFTTAIAPTDAPTMAASTIPNTTPRDGFDTDAEAVNGEDVTAPAGIVPP